MEEWPKHWLRLGSGAKGVEQCINLNRHSIIIEKESDYIHIAVVFIGLVNCNRLIPGMMSGRCRIHKEHIRPQWRTEN